MPDLDPHFLLANTIDAYAKAAATERLSVPGFDRATFQCQDSMLAGVTADFIKGVGDIHIRLRSLAEDDGCFDATKEKILCNLMAERSMPGSSRSRTVADYIHSDERDHRISCACGSEILIAHPDLMNEVLKQVSGTVLTAHTRSEWSPSERLEASISEYLDRIMQSIVERFLVENLSDGDLSSATGSIGSDRSTVAQAIKQEECLRSLRESRSITGGRNLSASEGDVKLHSRDATYVERMMFERSCEQTCPLGC
jgi:hypothetical protein